MTQFLLQLFVKNHTDREDPHVRAAIGVLSSWVGIGCNLLLFGAKLLLGWLAGSVSILADAMNNLSDASGSIVTLIGFRVADKPADARHPYGHARAEYVSGLAVAMMILFIGFELGKTSLGKILEPRPVALSGVMAGILLGSVCLKLWLSLFNRELGRAIHSTTLLAVSADSRNDCAATLAVLAAAGIESLLDLRVDGLFGLGIACFIVHSGWSLAGDTVSSLLGENADPELRSRIVSYIERQPKVLGFHDLMVHDYGPGQRFATLHVEMDYREDPMECHECIDDMERECLRSHNVHLVIHYDPVITDDPVAQQLKERVTGLLQQRDPRLRLHDFRMVRGRRHQNLVFDVSLPEELADQKQLLRSFIEDTLNAQGPGAYHVHITYDNAAFES